MLKSGDREPAMSDMDGRLMALEQNARGLNARLRAIEKSFSGNSHLVPARAGTQAVIPDHLSSHIQDIDDFVPAAEIAVQYEQTGVQESQGLNGQTTLPPVPISGRKNTPGIKLLLFDATGLVAGLIMVLISVLLYTGNMEMLKNPLMPLVSGVLLIACVCLRLYYQ